MPFGISFGGAGGPVGGGPSPKLRAVIEELMRDPLKTPEIAAKLKREDPQLLIELTEWIKSRQ